MRKVDSSGVVQISVEDLASHLDTLEAQLSGVQTIEVTRGDTVIAELKAPETKLNGDFVPGRVPPPDIMARLRKIYGDKPLNVDTTEWVSEGRD